jgi:hypothetical protein
MEANQIVNKESIFIRDFEGFIEFIKRELEL